LILGLFFLTSAGSWFYFLRFKHDKYVWLTPKYSDRLTAAVDSRKLPLYDSPVKALSQKYLAPYIKANIVDQVWMIEIPLFAVAGKETKWNLSCVEYPYINLVFKAKNMASSGDLPKLSIHANCEIVGDMIKPIAIPLINLKEAFVLKKETEFNFPESKVTIENLYFDWPSSWELDQINLMSDSVSSKNDLSLNYQELKFRGRTPVIFLD
jgi:hypothetical protein